MLASLANCSEVLMQSIFFFQTFSLKKLDTFILLLIRIKSVISAKLVAVM
jgi:hypothetical protein